MSVRGRLAFGFLDLLAACLVAIGVFRGLPSRAWAVDGCAAAVTLLLAVSGVGLMLGTRWAPRVARATSIVVLVIGLALVATLALTASYLAGIYGPVGKGGAVILVLVAALGLPYLVALPASQLLWLGRPGPR
jgi:hypothetical protein